MTIAAIQIKSKPAPMSYLNVADSIARFLEIDLGECRRVAKILIASGHLRRCRGRHIERPDYEGVVVLCAGCVARAINCSWKLLPEFVRFGELTAALYAAKPGDSINATMRTGRIEIAFKLPPETALVLHKIWDMAQQSHSEEIS